MPDGLRSYPDLVWSSWLITFDLCFRFLTASSGFTRVTLKQKDYQFSAPNWIWTWTQNHKHCRKNHLLYYLGTILLRHWNHKDYQIPVSTWIWNQSHNSYSRKHLLWDQSTLNLRFILLWIKFMWYFIFFSFFNLLGHNTHENLMDLSVVVLHILHDPNIGLGKLHTTISFFSALS